MVDVFVSSVLFFCPDNCSIDESCGTLLYIYIYIYIDIWMNLYAPRLIL